MVRSVRNIVALGLLSCALAAAAHDLVMARSGTLPILLTAPHGGTEGVPNASLRSRGTTAGDAHTIELMEGVASQLERLLGEKPYVVAARFSRKYIDANRSEGEAFEESPAARQAYNAYHDAIRRFVEELRERFPRGALLVDIHGQSEDPAVVHRGTQNGATVSALLHSRGPEALIGPSSVLGVLQAKTFNVFPPNTPLGEPREDKRFNGGYTVRTYGSGKPDGIDALQIEVGSRLRTDPGFIAALGEGIAVFRRACLSQP